MGAQDLIPKKTDFQLKDYCYQFIGTRKIMFPCTLLEESTRERASNYPND